MSAGERGKADQQRFAQWALDAKRKGESPAIPAATVVVLRDTPDGPSTLMLRKNSRIAFGGMWVFPGGRIDLADHTAGHLADRAPGHLADHLAKTSEITSDNPFSEISAARTAAVREAMEEAAIEIDPAHMVLFAHWLPPPITPKRYSTWFFAAAVQSGDVTIDDGEIVDNEWMTPDMALARHHDGEIELVPPTWVTLSTIRGFDSVDAVLSSLHDRPARHYETHIALTDAGPVAMWDGDAGYATSDASATGARHRLEMLESGYVFNDSGATE